MGSTRGFIAAGELQAHNVPTSWPWVMDRATRVNGTYGFSGELAGSYVWSGHEARPGAKTLAELVSRQHYPSERRSSSLVAAESKIAILAMAHHET
jgi:hypothetical protein